jgi:hypothetical protein
VVQHAAFAVNHRNDSIADNALQQITGATT